METSAKVIDQRNRRSVREDDYLQNRCNIRRVVNRNTVLELSGKATVRRVERARAENGNSWHGSLLLQVCQVTLELIVTLE